MPRRHGQDPNSAQPELISVEQYARDLTWLSQVEFPAEGETPGAVALTARGSIDIVMPWADGSGGRWLVTLTFRIGDAGISNIVGLDLRSLPPWRTTGDLIETSGWRALVAWVVAAPGDGVSAGLVREVPVGAMKRRAQAHIAGALRAAAPVWTELSRPDIGDKLSMYAERLREGEGRGGRPPLSVEHLTEVARIYREAMQRGEAPTRAVAAWGGPGAQGPVAKGTAAKWISTCRRHGLLPPTQRGRAKA